jgi:alkyldihydroxyacetonephosphate synthase
VNANRGAPTPPIAIEGSGPVTGRLEGDRVEVDDALRRRLADVCTEVQVGDGPRAEAGRDWWPLAMQWALAGQVTALPAVVARPASTDEVAAVLGACNEARVPVTPAAGRSGVCGASVPVHGGVALDLTGLEGITDVDDTSLLVEVRPGTFGDVFED